MIEIVALNRVERDILKLIDKESYELLKDQLIDNPQKGIVMPGTGGMRKLRVSLEGRGKSGGLRLIYYYINLQGRIYLIEVFAKNEKADLTQKEKNALKKLAEELAK